MSNLCPISMAALLLLVMFGSARALFVPTASRYVRVSLAATSGKQDKETPSDDLKENAYPQQTPHSGRHFRPSHPAYQSSWLRKMLPKKRRQRFLEGWYYRVTLTEHNVSFAFIVSIEDPGLPQSELRLACIQVVGPDDGYLVQGSRDDTKFWAWKGQQGLGYAFDYYEEKPMNRMKTAMTPSEWRDRVKSGFQILPTHIQGRVEGHDARFGSVIENPGNPATCSFDMVLEPLVGWGGSKTKQQKSTAGWLASFAVFEPHWQVTLADARATGTITWRNKTYEFTDEPFYAEKNWGAAMPTKWYWTQCNSFHDYQQLSVTAGGGIRKIPFGKEEALGMVSVHYNGTFYEAVPWAGEMEWEVEKWGKWKLTGRSTTDTENPFEVEYISTCGADKGTIIMAPTVDEGMIPFANDSFEADATLSLWSLEWDEKRKQFARCYPPIIDEAKSSQGAVEVGGPWSARWKETSKMNRVLKKLVRLPYSFRRKFRKRQKSS